MQTFLQVVKMSYSKPYNESLHHVIWGLAPKEQYASPRETSLAVGLCCLLFNSGAEVTYSQLLPNIGLNVSEEMISAWIKIDKKRCKAAASTFLPVFLLKVKRIARKYGIDIVLWEQPQS